MEVAAKHVDTYLSWGETPDERGLKVQQVDARARAHGRTLTYGAMLYVTVRETDEAAWAVAEDMQAHMDGSAIAANARFVGNTDQPPHVRDYLDLYVEEGMRLQVSYHEEAERCRWGGGSVEVGLRARVRA